MSKENIVFRLTCEYNTAHNWVKGVVAEDMVVIYEHTEAERTHIHGLILGSKITILGLKKQIEKSVGKFNRTDWSFKHADDEYERYLVYCSKGKLMPVYYKQFSERIVPIDFEKLKSDWVPLKIKGLVKLKPSRWDLVEEMISYVRFDIPNPNFQDRAVWKIVYKAVLKTLRRHKLRTCVYLTSSYIEEVCRDHLQLENQFEEMVRRKTFKE